MGRGKRIASGNVGYGRTFYADEPEDLAYLKKLAKETRGDESKWPELDLRIYGRPKQQKKVENNPALADLCLGYVRLRQALGYLIDDDRFQVSVGGNPDVVEKMLIRVRRVYQETAPEEEKCR